MNIYQMNKQELTELIKLNSEKTDTSLLDEALLTKKKYYGDKIFVRGLIEISNICKNNCYYCGIRADNKDVLRYRLTKEDILSCCKTGYELGFKTFVLQGGEDSYYTDKIMCDIISSIKELYPECAVTLSIGEKSKKTYKAYKNAGADRFLLRHETADDCHYQKLHPENLSLKSRKKCLYDLKECGFQVGAGFMVGSPYQTYENLAEDLLFLKELEPQMVGIGPFIPHHNTPFKSFPKGSYSLTITMLALTRLMLPSVLLPATTALATLDNKNGRADGFFAGANVVMPNLSPKAHRKDYSLYDGKLSTGSEAAQSINNLKEEIERIGFSLDMSRGDNIEFLRKRQSK